MQKEDPIITYNVYQPPYGWLLLSSVVVAIAFPIVSVTYIAIVLAIGFSLLPLTLFLAAPFFIVCLAITGVLIMVKLLAKVYRRMKIWDPSLLAFNVVVTYLTFYYGLYKVMGSYSNYGGIPDNELPVYFGISAVPITFVLFIFCLLCPLLYEWLSEKLGLHRWILVSFPLAYAGINIWQLGL